MATVSSDKVALLAAQARGILAAVGSPDEPMDLLLNMLASAFIRDDPRFDYAKFRSDCGMSY